MKGKGGGRKTKRARWRNRQKDTLSAELNRASRARIHEDK